jgi:hypothetical protein
MLCAAAALTALPSSPAQASDLSPKPWPYGCAVTYSVDADVAAYIPTISASLAHISEVTEQTFTLVAKNPMIKFQPTRPGDVPDGWDGAGASQSTWAVRMSPFPAHQGVPPALADVWRQNMVTKAIMMLLGASRSTDSDSILGPGVRFSTEFGPADVAALTAVRDANRCGTADAVIVKPGPVQAVPSGVYDVLRRWHGQRVTRAVCRTIPRAIWDSENRVCLRPVR